VAIGVAQEFFFGDGFSAQLPDDLLDNVARLRQTLDLQIKHEGHVDLLDVREALVQVKVKIYIGSG